MIIFNPSSRQTGNCFLD